MMAYPIGSRMVYSMSGRPLPDISVDLSNGTSSLSDIGLWVQQQQVRHSASHMLYLHSRTTVHRSGGFVQDRGIMQHPYGFSVFDGGLHDGPEVSPLSFFDPCYGKPIRHCFVCLAHYGEPIVLQSLVCCPAPRSSARA